MPPTQSWRIEYFSLTKCVSFLPLPSECFIANCLGLIWSHLVHTVREKILSAVGLFYIFFDVFLTAILLFITKEKPHHLKLNWALFEHRFWATLFTLKHTPLAAVYESPPFTKRSNDWTIGHTTENKKQNFYFQKCNKWSVRLESPSWYAKKNEPTAITQKK